MRHKKAEKRKIEPDTIYKSALIAKLINYIMRDGKKTTAQHQVYGAMNIIKDKGEDPLKVLEKAVQNVAPKVEVRARRVGGANYQVPVEVRHDRRNALAFRWIIEASRKRPNKEYHSYGAKLAAELTAASQNLGEAIRKRDVTLKQAESNRAFAHFRW